MLSSVNNQISMNKDNFNSSQTTAIGGAAVAAGLFSAGMTTKDG